MKPVKITCRPFLSSNGKYELKFYADGIEITEEQKELLEIHIPRIDELADKRYKNKHKRF